MGPESYAITILDPDGASDLLRRVLRQAVPSAGDGPYHSPQEVVYRIRTTAGFTVTDLAWRLGVTPQAVSIVECGTSSFAAGALDRLATLAAYYSLPQAAVYVRALAVQARQRSYRRGGWR